MEQQKRGRSLEIKFQKETLIKEWEKLKQDPSDSLVVKVIDVGRFVSQVGFEFEVQAKAPEAKSIADDPLKQFTGIASRGIHKIIKPSDVTGSKWDDPLIPGGLVAYPTTGEDIYRYILGLPTDYTKDDVTRASRDLLFKWHPDKNKDNLVYAEQVYQLVEHAKGGLEAALEAKKK